MSESDKKPKAPDLSGEIDWDSALDEWENKTFVPEVARDKETDKTAALTGAAAKPLYKPPVPGVSSPAIPQPPRSQPKAEGAPPPPAPPRPPPPPPPAPPVIARPSPAFREVELMDDYDDESGATVIAAIPRELLRGAGKPEESPKSARGGLGQLFSKGEQPLAAKSDEIEVLLEAPSPSRVTSRPPPLLEPSPSSDGTSPAHLIDDPDPSVVTSAKHLPAPLREKPKSAEMLKRPSQVDPGEHIPEGAMFDPFAEPPTASGLEHSTAAVTSAKPALPRPAPPIVPPPEDARLPLEIPSMRPEVSESEELDDAAAAALLADIEETISDNGDGPLQAPARADGLTEALQSGDNATPGPALLAPEQRRYDPNEETFIVSKKALAKGLTKGAVALIGASDEEDDQATRVRSRSESQLDGPGGRSWRDEKATAEWLNEGGKRGFADRAAWLEREVRAAEDKTVRARGLVALSELRAILGDPESAETLAVEARDLAPTVAMAHRQARALMPKPRDVEQIVEALDVEMRNTAAPAARIHSALLAADALRASGDDEGATKRYEQAFRLVPNDVRAPIARAARALARSEMASAALRMPDAPELAPVAAALGAALRLRGVERAGQASQESTEPLPNDSLRRARQALDAGDTVFAATLLAELRLVPELARGATWLAASLGATRVALRSQAADWTATLLEGGSAANTEGDLARRVLASRGLELGDPVLVEKALAGATTFSAAERATLTALMSLGLDRVAVDLDALMAEESLAPLGAAIGAMSRQETKPEAEGGQQTKPEGQAGSNREAQVLARAGRVAGSASSRASVRLARLIGSSAPESAIEAALKSVGDDAPPIARAIALELAVRAERFGEVSDALGAWPAARVPDHCFAGALIAERCGDTKRALDAFREAKKQDPTCEAAVRAVAALDPSEDLAKDLHALADELESLAPATDGAPASQESVRAALTRLEAVARVAAPAPDAAASEGDANRAEQLERAHRAAPSLPIAAFLAERIARRAGDVEGVLRWIRERRANSTDSLESALDGVREALLVAESDHALASERLEEAHRARPTDVALRELYERMAQERPTDGAAWREQRAATAPPESRALMLLEAAYDYERAGDRTSALRAAEAASATGDDGLIRAVRERTELEASQVSRLTDELLGIAKSTESPIARRDAYERLAVLDAIGRGDNASALLWHRSILEEFPQYLPSLRHVEHALIQEGRDDELEPIATTLAKRLANGGGAECSAHAQLAARLHLRSGDWDGTRELVELAAAQPEPSLWSLRMLQAHARSRGDDKGYIACTQTLVLRMTRPQEVAALLSRAGEAASRMGDLPQARELLERAATEDPGDVVTWGLLADVRQRAGDARGSAEACESLARTSVVAEHQLLAWYDAGRIWLDEVKDDERGIIALEQAGALDVTFQDIFTRLSALYSARKSQGELASLLERRIERITDPEERITMEIERGRVLLDVGDPASARSAFEAALAVRPDDPVALGLFAELCAQEREWDAAEQAWVRLARLLPTPDEQRKVYSRLGDLYATHAVNLARAEVAFREVLKRAPDDAPTMERLIKVFLGKNDATSAVEMQQELINAATAPSDKTQRLIELAGIFESTGRDNRKAEQTLETARRAYPSDVVVVRALADFYKRHNQLPAVNILLDRAASDARRAIAAGRFAPAMFEMMQTCLELRGKRDAARILAATLAALEGKPADLQGAGPRGLDPLLDDTLAPEAISSSLRALLTQTGEALDAAAPLDVHALGATPLPASATALSALVTRMATAIGLANVQVLVSAKLGRGCIPASSTPPTIVLGEALVSSPRESARAFLIARALKIVGSKASAIARAKGSDLEVLIPAWVQAFNPAWAPEGGDLARIAEVSRRIAAALPRKLGDDVGVMALDVAGSLGAELHTIGASTFAWANRAALLALGDPNAALDAIAFSEGSDGAPVDPEQRAAWIGGDSEAKDIVAFSVSDTYADLRARLGI